MNLSLRKRLSIGYALVVAIFMAVIAITVIVPLALVGYATKKSRER